MERETQETRSFAQSSYGNDKLDKSKELNSDMTIKETSPDEYTNKLENLGGNN